jgi:adenine C2-methylase RlmN of 23S rRNA A2503 and tRNA A37
MNCPFCATGQAGLTRNLSAGEITDQIVAAARACANGEMPGGPTRLSNIVFMGMGEPLANYNAVVRTLRNITDSNPDGVTQFNPMKMYTSKELIDYMKAQGKPLQILWDDFKLWRK